MNKQELVAKLAEERVISLKQAGETVDALIGAVIASLKNGEEVKLPGLGTLRVKTRAARKGVVPGTNNPISIPARKTVVFTASKLLKEEL